MAQRYLDCEVKEPLQKRIKREDLLDFILDVNGVEIHVNKLILEEEFSVMKHRLLYIPEEENRLRTDKEDPEVVQMVLNCVSGKYISGENGIIRCKDSVCLDEVTKISEVSQLIDLAFSWDGPMLKADLFAYLQRNLREDSFFVVNTLAEKYSIYRLQEECGRFLVQNFCQLCGYKDFNQMSKDQILSALKSPQFKTCCWQAVFESIVTWVNYEDSRRDFFAELFDCIKLWKLSPDYLENAVESNVLVRNDPVCLKKVCKAYKEIYKKSEGVVLLGSDDLVLKVYFPLSRRSFKLVQQPDLFFPIHHDAVILQNDLYVFFIDGSVFRLNLVTKGAAWEEIASTMWTWLHITTVHDNIYALGGTKHNSHGEKYVPSENIWKNIPISFLETDHYSIASAGGFIYIIGITMYLSEAVPSMEKFNPSDETVEFASPMNAAVSCPSIAVYEEKIYAAGLLKTYQPFSMNLEVLDTKTGIWTTALFTSEGMHILTAFAAHSSVYFIGQLDNSVTTTKIHTMSVPTTCNHLKITKLETMEKANCTFSVVLPQNLAGYDFIIRTGNKEFPAHRNVLSLSFDYFKLMFSLDMLENITGIVEMAGIDSRVLRKCIDYAYNAGCPSFTLKNVEAFLHAATYMQSPGLLQSLANFLCKHLTINTFEFMKRLSSKYCHAEVEDACDNFALKNFKEVTHLPCFVNMEKEYVEFLVMFRQSTVNDEREAYDCILRWVKAENGCRDVHFKDLFTILDLTKLPEVFVIEEIPSEALVNENNSCLRIVLASLSKRKELYEVICLLGTDLKVFSPKFKKWKTMWSDREHITTMQSVVGCKSGQYFYGLDYGADIHKLEYRDFNAEWQHVVEQEDFIDVSDAVAVDDFLFIITTNTIWEYNTVKRKWRSIELFLESFCFTSVVVERSIYMVGGVNEWEEAIATVHCFNTTTEELHTDLEPMMQPRCNAGGASYDGKIYITGGSTDDDGGEALTSVEFYNVLANSWTSIPEMNFPRESHLACFVDGKLYVVGGVTGLEQTMEYYDEEAQNWKIEMMPDSKRRQAVVGSIPYEVLCHCKDDSEPG